ncbi:hypothetical protein FA95DRAFT_1455194, partial [Auriscalpium vulgare]
MPLRGAKTAPIFASDPRSVRRFFSDFETVAALAGLASDRAMKDWTQYYVSIEVADLFDSIPEFNDASTFSDFKTAVTSLYPGADQDRTYSSSDLETLIATTRTISPIALDQFAAYHREFLAISGFLIKRNRYSALQQKSDFPRGIPNTLWDRISARLQVMKPDVTPGDSYDVSDVNSAAQFAL